MILNDPPGHDQIGLFTRMVSVRPSQKLKRATTLTSRPEKQNHA